MPPAALNKPLIASVASITLAALVCLWQIPGLMGATFGPDPSKGAVSTDLAGALAAHADELDRYRARFDGRSAFFRPKPPLIEPRIVVKPPKIDDPPPAAPPIQTFYSGPKPTFVIGQEVYFEGGTHLRVGEENNGVKVVATDPPWTITLAQHGRNHVIDIFKRSSDSLGSSTSRSNGSALPPGMTIVKPAAALAKRDDEAGQ